MLSLSGCFLSHYFSSCYSLFCYVYIFYVPTYVLQCACSYVAISLGATVLYATSWQAVSEDLYGEMGELLREALGTAFAAFLAGWILTYTACTQAHPDSPDAISLT